MKIRTNVKAGATDVSVKASSKVTAEFSVDVSVKVT